MPRSIHRCPQCREPVSPFAAGCAVCGADLERARADLSARQASRPTAKVSQKLPRIGIRPGVVGFDWQHTVIAVLLAVFASPFGLILAGYWTLQYLQASNTVMKRVMAAVAVLALAALLDPDWIWAGVRA